MIRVRLTESGQSHFNWRGLSADTFRPNLPIIDELGFVPLSRTSAELLFKVFSQRYERGSILVTTNLPFDEWTEMFGTERLTGALLDRLLRHSHVIDIRGESYRLKDKRQSELLTSSRLLTSTAEETQIER